MIPEDYMELLTRYMAHVIDAEGTSLVESMAYTFKPTLRPYELAELRAIEAEARRRLNPDRAKL